MRILLRFVVIALTLGIATVALGNLAERWLIYPFDTTVVAPEDVGLTGVEAHHLTINNEILVVWKSEPKQNTPLVLYFHGNAGNLAERAGRFKRLRAQGYGIVAPAYRGSSGSSGIPVEQDLTSDALAIYKATLAGLDWKTAPRIVLYGESLGAAVVLALNAALIAEKEQPPAAIILEAPFSSIPDLSEHHYPGTAALAQRFDNLWPSLERARFVVSPLLILHGTRDDLIPIEMGRQIFAATPSREKEFLAIQGAGHTDLWRPETQRQIWRFISKATPSTSDSRKSRP